MDAQKYRRLEYLQNNLKYLSEKEYQEYLYLTRIYEQENGQYFTEDDYGYEQYDQEDITQQPYDYSQANPDYREAGRLRAEERKRQDALRVAQTPKGNKLKKRPKSRRAADADEFSPENDVNQTEKPKKKKKKKHWFRRIFILLFLIIAVMVGFFIYGYQRGVKHEGGVIKAEKFTGLSNKDGSTNILLIGADQRPWQTNGEASHSDSMMVMNVNNKTGKINLVSFMRDTLVTIPNVSPAGETQDVKLNAAYTIGEQNNHQGAQLVNETLKQNFGINIKYFAIVDFSSFATVIDSLFPTGLEIDATFSTVDGTKLPAVPVPDDMAATEGKVASDKDLSAEEAAALGYPDGGGTFMMIKSGKQKMNGRMLLNYARFRHDDEGDFGRVKRQQQVVSTVMSKVKNPLTLFTGSAALGTARAVTMSNIPNSWFLFHGFGLMKDGKQGINSVTIPSIDDSSLQNGYDIYGGLGLLVDLDKYKSKAQELLGQ